MNNQPPKKPRKLEADKEEGAAQDLLRKLKFNKGVSIREEGEVSPRRSPDLDVDTTMEQMKAGKNVRRLTRQEYDQLVLRGRHFTPHVSQNQSMALPLMPITPLKVN